MPEADRPEAVPPLAALADGTPVRVRQIRPADRERLLAGFEQLSNRSRQMRFMAGKGGLSDAEVTFFTQPDGVQHYAIAALALDQDGEETEGLGTARFVRAGADDDCAEVAVTVLDRWQRQGIGRLLLTRLRTAALERGVRRFRVQLLAENHAARGLMRRVLGPGRFERGHGVLLGEFDLVKV